MSFNEVFPGNILLWLGLGAAVLFMRWIFSEASRPGRARGADQWQRTAEDFETRRERQKYFLAFVSFVALVIAFLILYEQGQWLDGLFGPVGPNHEGLFAPRPKR